MNMLFFRFIEPRQHGDGPLNVRILQLLSQLLLQPDTRVHPQSHYARATHRISKVRSLDRVPSPQCSQQRNTANQVQLHSRMS